MSRVRTDMFEQFVPKGKIVEYNMVERESSSNMESVIGRLLKDGWYLYGSPFSHGIRVVQALVKVSE